MFNPQVKLPDSSDVTSLTPQVKRVGLKVESRILVGMNARELMEAQVPRGRLLLVLLALLLALLLFWLVWLLWSMLPLCRAGGGGADGVAGPHLRRDCGRHEQVPQQQPQEQPHSLQVIMP